VPVRRPHEYAMDAIESDSAVAVVFGICAGVGPSPGGFVWDQDGSQPLRHDSAETVEDWRVGACVCSAGVGLAGRRVSVAGIVPSNLPPTRCGENLPHVPPASLLRAPTTRVRPPKSRGGKGAFTPVEAIRPPATPNPPFRPIRRNQNPNSSPGEKCGLARIFHTF
jgi:hypothetical protein